MNQLHRHTVIASLVGVTLLTAAACSTTAPPNGDWAQYGGDIGFNRYSPLSQINAQNVSGLRVLWTKPAIDAEFASRFPDVSAGKYFKSTPFVLNGIAYAPNGLGLIEAFDGATGKTLWVQEPPSDDLRDVAGTPARGAGHWGEGDDLRIISVRNGYLYALDARTCSAVSAFGEKGRVDLSKPNPRGRRHSVSGGPLVAGDVIVVGGGSGSDGDYSQNKKHVPQPVQAFDARTGAKLWEFSPLPAEGDPARESWGNGSDDIAGDMASYGQMTADLELGYVYVPFSSASPPGYGGWRPGDNLYGTSLVAIDLQTGRKVWHFQTVRHDIWDFDLAAPPVLGDVTVNGKRIKAVMATGKVPLLFALDRVTGKPIWPIEERPAPQSTVPGEVMPATQPIPTKPEALDRVGVTEDDLVDFTPELRAEALAALKTHTYGPIYTPPTLMVEGGNQGTLTLPGTDGGGNWNTGAFDPETGVYYGMTTTAVATYRLVKPTQAGADLDWVGVDVDSTFAFYLPSGLPLVKPPYGRITAVDMNTGEKLWTAANGDGPRDHPLLKGLNLPPLGLPGRVAVAVTKDLIFAPESGDATFLADVQKGFGNKFRAFDKRTGKVLAEITLPAGATGAPITYMAGGKQYILVAIGDSRIEPQWVAIGL